MAQSSVAAAAAASSHHRRKRARHHQNSGVGGSIVKDIQTMEMREAINRDGEMGGVLLERGYLGAKLYTGPDFTTGLLPGQHDQILAEMKWVHADVVGVRDLKQAQCRRVASAVKDYWRVRKKQQEQGGGQHVRLGKMVDGIESRRQGEPTVALTKASADDILMMDRHGDEAVFSDEESQYSNAAEARASIDPLRDIIDRLNDASAVWMPDKGPPIQSATSSGSSSTILRPAVMSSISDDHDDDAAVCSTVFVPGVVGFPDPGAEPRWRMNELLSNQRTLLHEIQFSEAARARLPALFTAMVREMSTHPVGDQESVVKTPQSIPSAVAKSKVPGRYKKPAIAATAAQQQGGMVPVTEAWDERENLLLLAASARALPRCFDQKSSSTHFMVERRREVLRGSAAADLQDDSMDLVTGLVHGVSWRTVEIGMRCTMEGIAGHDKIRSNSSCARRANEMLTERRPMIPPTGTIWRDSLEGMVREKQRQVGLPVDVHIDQSADHSVDEATPTVVEQTLSKVNDGGLEKPFGKQEDALALFHYRRGLTTPTFAAFCPTKSVSSVMVVGRRRGLGDSAYSRIGQTRWRLPRVRKCIQKSSSATSVSSPLVYRRRRGGRGGRQCSSIMRASMSRLAIPVSFSEPLKAWDEYIATTSHQSSCRWLTTAVTLMGAARRRRASECREMRVLQWEAPPIGSPTSPLALRNAHANALLALQKYASVSMGGASVKQPSSCMGSEAMRLLTFAAHKMKEQRTDNGSGIQVIHHIIKTRIYPYSGGSYEASNA
ncbi:hypothetical protein Pmar_PMAR005132 [Perkinsus marinus ATCC 50983]|uniref:HSA domain-containing protein n=1 Tax=Perkinsus marinus (strain ATCC 50983 / TXsc) TaxID=423536 RepID=C5KAQ1_PERM5|nr:hypothetical protein Pmar_PMAR005132 [Perkinsus marinus ATCC 50983]EER18227.1 hypothetical protein Pmar_PMAR005132 [Perkinsus marinus ATCC 50983]|eukprot:XP_002786431.1 hypothetical protein Pmar_PMAR005132 [Perkinsus marinus ATCC 50983]